MFFVHFTVLDVVNDDNDWKCNSKKIKRLGFFNNIIISGLTHVLITSIACYWQILTMLQFMFTQQQDICFFYFFLFLLDLISFFFLLASKKHILILLLFWDIILRILVFTFPQRQNFLLSFLSPYAFIIVYPFFRFSKLILLFVSFWWRRNLRSPSSKIFVFFSSLSLLCLHFFLFSFTSRNFVLLFGFPLHDTLPWRKVFTFTIFPLIFFLFLFLVFIYKEFCSISIWILFDKDKIDITPRS